MTGLILPGMMEEPGCNAGRVISKSPALGREDIRRKSLQIVEMAMPARFMAPDIAI
jgi:hypothetical protein